MDAAMPSVSPCTFGHNVDVPACSKGIEDLQRMLSGWRNQPDGQLQLPIGLLQDDFVA